MRPAVSTAGLFLILKLNIMFKVKIEEYEKGWGSKIDEIKEFETKELANSFIETFNSKNTEEIVPDWYMVASPYNY